jgi:hypothetical protein
LTTGLAWGATDVSRSGAFIETDPLFTQVALQTGEGRPSSTAAALEHYTELKTVTIRLE